MMINRRIWSHKNDSACGHAYLRPLSGMWKFSPEAQNEIEDAPLERSDEVTKVYV